MAPAGQETVNICPYSHRLPPFQEEKSSFNRFSLSRNHDTIVSHLHTTSSTVGSSSHAHVKAENQDANNASASSIT